MQLELKNGTICCENLLVCEFFFGVGGRAPYTFALLFSCHCIGTFVTCVCCIYILSIAQLQIYVAEYPYYRIVQEGDGNIRVCFQTNRIVTEPLHVHVETAYINTAGNAPAIGKTNMNM